MTVLNRRKFIQTSALAEGAASLSSFAVGKEGEPANNKINCAVVGVSGMGGYATKDAENMKVKGHPELDKLIK